VREVAGNLHAIDEMAERMGRIVNQLKSFARKEGSDGQPIELALAVRNVLLMLDHRLRTAPVEVIMDVPAGLRVIGDLNRLEQVLLNLAGNALDAMSDHPPRRLRIAARSDGERVVVQIIDSGPGMTDTQMQRLFEPFFTTKSAGQGLGLGLVISSKIVGEFGGTLRASRGETGMQFEFDLETAGATHV
jgi:two-component system C4-dicarboxylate transport sensor histidine kinase DctB